MKVKLKKHKKSPAPCATEQVCGKETSNIDVKRMIREIIIPRKVVTDYHEIELTYSEYRRIIESILGATVAIKILKQLENVIKEYNLQYTPKLLKCVMQCVELKVISDRSCE